LNEWIRHRGRITNFWRGEFASNNLMMFVHRKIELAPSTASRNVMFLLIPFVFVVDPESGGINDYGGYLVASPCSGRAG